MTRHMLLKSTATTFVVYFNNGETDHMVGSFPKTKIGMMNAAVALTTTKTFLVADEIHFDVGSTDASAMIEAIVDASYMMSHVRDARIALTEGLQQVIDAAGEFPMAVERGA